MLALSILVVHFQHLFFPYGFAKPERSSLPFQPGYIASCLIVGFLTYRLFELRAQSFLRSYVIKPNVY